MSGDGSSVASYTCSYVTDAASTAREPSSFPSLHRSIVDPNTLDWPDLPEISLRDAAGRLSSIAEQSQARATYLTRRGRPVAALVSPQVLARQVADAEELADMRAADTATEDALWTTLVSWEDARATLGLPA